MVQHSTTNVYQEMFESAVAALLVALSRVPKVLESGMKMSRKSTKPKTRSVSNRTKRG